MKRAALCVLLLAGPALAAKGDGKQDRSPKDPPGVVRVGAEAQRNMGLKFTHPTRARIAQPVQAPGTVMFDQGHVARLRPFAQGRVMRLLVAPGDSVRAGQPLVELDTPSLADGRDTLAGAQAALRQAQAELDVAEAAQRRGEMLARDGSLSRAEAERRRAETARARASVDTARATVTAGESRIARLAPLPGGAPGTATLTSPIDGVVVTVGITPGEVVDPATEALVVADLSIMAAIAQISESQATLVRVGDPARIRLTAGPDRTWTGEVVATAAQLDAQSRTLSARILLPNPDRALRAGMLVQITLSADRGRDGLEVPASAVQTIDDKPVAFVRTGPDRFERHDLTLGVQRPDIVEVRKGLSEADEVATDGSFQLKAILQRDLLGGTD